TSEQVLINVGERGEDKKGKEWFITDLAHHMTHYTAKRTEAGVVVTLDPQVYLAPEKVTIAKTVYNQGFFVNAKLDVLGIEASATIDIDAKNGIAADCAMSKIVIGTEKLFSIANTKG